MDKIRIEIETLDKDLIKLLAKRMRLCEKLGKHKKNNNLPIVYKDRENDLLAFWCELAKENRVSSGFIKKLLSLILKESIKIQKSGSLYEK